MARSRFLYGFLGALAIAVTFNVLSFMRVFYPACFDCGGLVVGVPIPFYETGGEGFAFVVEPRLHWDLFIKSLVSTLAVAVGSGLVSMRLLPPRR
jgi:hypothetical protein